MRFTVIALSLVAILVTANSARADKRVAFVVGNGAYKNFEQLSNPSISAKAMDDGLKKLGFEVVEVSLLDELKAVDYLLIEFLDRREGTSMKSLSWR